MDELQHQIMDKKGQSINRPDAEQIYINDAPNAEINDKLINTHVSIPYAGEMVSGMVKRRKRDGNKGLLIGKANEDPHLT